MSEPDFTENELDNRSWYPRALVERAEQKWPPVPTSESLSFFFAEAVRNHIDVDPAKYRRLVDTAAYCLEEVPPDIVENVLWSLPAPRTANPEKWSGNFNNFVRHLWRPAVEEHEVRYAMLRMVKEAP